jgi:hypothetical protein
MDEPVRLSRQLTRSYGLHDVEKNQESFRGDLVEAVIHSCDHCWDYAANVRVEH